VLNPKPSKAIRAFPSRQNQDPSRDRVMMLLTGRNKNKDRKRKPMRRDN
jgi:hypothetical protein